MHIEQIIIETVQSITDQKKEANRYPCFVLDTELTKELTRKIIGIVLKLRREKRLKLGRTINNNFIELIENT